MYNTTTFPFMEIPLQRLPNTPSQMYQRLFMGSYEPSISQEFLTKYNIKHVISLDTTGKYQRDGLASIAQMWSMPFDDKNYCINIDSLTFAVNHVRAVAAQIHQCLSQPYGNVYVHCFAGINRAAVSVAAFLILYQLTDPKQTIEWLRQSNATYRNTACLTNECFQLILIAYLK